MAERKMKSISKKLYLPDEDVEISCVGEEKEEVDVSPSSEELALEEVAEDATFEEISEEAKEKIGSVNCAKLNVRVSPSTTALVVCVLESGSKVSITDDSDPDFYKVYTETGAYGFCMKQFITVE